MPLFPQNLKQLVTKEQSQILDQQTQKIEDLSEEQLMERAGREISRALLKDFPNRKKIVILVGSGNNGGDGLVIARYWLRHIRQNFFNFQTKASSNSFSLTLLCLTQGKTELWKRKKIELEEEILKSKESSSFCGTEPSIHWVEGSTQIENYIHSVSKSSLEDHSTLVLDAVFGVGFSGELNQYWKLVFSYYNRKKITRLSVDLPSGLDGTTGIAAIGSFKSNRTYTIGNVKLGMVVGDGPFLCGPIKIVEIGFSKEILNEFNPKIFFYNKNSAQSDLPRRSSWRINKSHRGHLLVVAGSKGMLGAGAMASLAAARMGAGYVTWAHWPEGKRDQVELPWITSVLLTKRLDANGLFLKSLRDPTALVIGPGFGFTKRSEKLFYILYHRYSTLPAVIDADAVRLLKKLNLKLPDHWIMTPHEGELGYLLSVPSSEIFENRFKSLLQAQKLWGGIVLLKGFRSLIADTKNNIVVIGSGDSSLAKAGTGDVLSGFIGGLLALGLDPLRATCLAGYIHGKAGEYFSRKWKNDFSLIATDVIQFLPSVIKIVKTRERKSEV